MKDIRDYQIVFLICFLFLGITTRDWTVEPLFLLAIACSCLLTQWFLSSIVQYQKNQEQYNIPFDGTKAFIETITNPRVTNSLRSALITALGLCLLLRASNYQTMIIASVSAIASKFILQWHGKHLFNPANFGIICALLFTNNAWVSPGQWGTDWLYLLLFAGLGGVVLKKVGRWDTSVTFLIVYSLLLAIRIFWLGWSSDVWIHQLSSGSLLLFALFMISDPRSIPNNVKGRIIWSSSIAVLSFVLQTYFYLSTAVFWSLFIISPLTVLLDSIWSSPRFVWRLSMNIEH